MRWLLLVLLLCGCQSTGVITIPVAPAWVQPAATREFDSLTIYQQVQHAVPGAAVTWSDGIYTLLSARWVRVYTSWTWEAAKAIGLRYQPESFDCENFAGLFAEVARKKAADAGLHTAPLIAKVTVELSSGKFHAIVGVATDEGLFLIEPQPDAGPFRITPLASYPHRILRVDL
jgi:hypothetical protein